MDVNLNPQAVAIIEFLRMGAERDLGIPVSFDDTVNALICSYSRCLTDLGGDE